MLFLPLLRLRFTRPLFVVPEAERIMLAGLSLTVANEERSTVLDARTAAGECIAVEGSKRYVYAWMQYDADGWARHVGARWSSLCRMKAQYDPQMILSPDVIQYGAAAGAPRASAAGPAPFAFT